MREKNDKMSYHNSLRDFHNLHYSSLCLLVHNTQHTRMDDSPLDSTKFGANLNSQILRKVWTEIRIIFHLCSLYFSSKPFPPLLQIAGPHTRNLRHIHRTSVFIHGLVYRLHWLILLYPLTYQNTFSIIPVLFPLSFFPILIAAGFSGVMNSLICCFWCHIKWKNMYFCVTDADSELSTVILKQSIFTAPLKSEILCSVTSFTLKGAPLSFTVNSVVGSICNKQMVDLTCTNWKAIPCYTEL